MQPSRPNRPERATRPILMLTAAGMAALHGRPIPTPATGGAPMISLPPSVATSNTNVRPGQLLQRPATPRPIANQGIRQPSPLLQYSQPIRPSTTQQQGGISPRPALSASLARPVSAMFTRQPSIPTTSGSRPLIASNLLRGPHHVRPPSPSSSPAPSVLPAVASTSTSMGAPAPSPLIALPPSPLSTTSYSVVPGSAPLPTVSVTATGVPLRRFPMKQVNFVKVMQERRAATKRKLDEMVGGKNRNHPNWERKPEGLPLCPICMEVYQEAHVTKCGHTYCHECICVAIDFQPKCPSCNTMISKQELVPNLVIAQVVASQKAKIAKTEPAEGTKPDETLKDMDVAKYITTRSNYLNLSDVNVMLTLLERRKEILTSESKQHQRQLLLEFLSQLHKIKQAEKSVLERQVSLLERDIKLVKEFSSTNEASKESSAVPQSALALVGPSTSQQMRGFNTNVPHNDILSSSVAAKKKRLHRHYDELVKLYLENRRSILYDDSPVDDDDDSSLPEDDYSVDLHNPDNPLNDFANTLSKISRYHSLKPLATFSYSADNLGSSNIVSSIEFDKDNEFFAIAGVTKKIKLFEYATVLGSSVDIHCPNAELSCNAKISCVSWSGYFKNKLASSDYDGSVTLWDTAVGNKISTLTEHERRVWSVDWSNGDPRLFASGSDDTKVKLWNFEQEKSVLTVDSSANVCCVKFCPQNAFHIAFGSADHCIHYYDFRNPKKPIGILEGHKKAVSYVKFATSMELISASTDSNLKLWDLATFEEVHSFRGHINEKNFVGLATDGDYIACGSENNSVFVYYKKLPKPLFAYKFDNHRSMLHPPTPDDTSEFVSAVAWRKGSPIIVAANSQGSIKVLEMQT